MRLSALPVQPNAIVAKPVAVRAVSSFVRRYISSRRAGAVVVIDPLAVRLIRFVDRVKRWSCWHPRALLWEKPIGFYSACRGGSHRRPISSRPWEYPALTDRSYCCGIRGALAASSARLLNGTRLLSPFDCLQNEILWPIISPPGTGGQ